MKGPVEGEWEIVIVDNDSQDNTKQVVDTYEHTCPFPVRYVKENRIGLSVARNRGVCEARGRLIAFTDDDVIVDKNWGRNTVNGFKNPEVACIGGKTLPIWEHPKPGWLSKDLFGKLALLDLGKRPLRMNKPNLWGANLAIRADICRCHGSFNTRLGRVPGKLYAGEETDLIGRILAGDEKVMYFPDIIVHHRIFRTRMKKMYFRRWAFDQGELSGILLGGYPHRNVLGVPFYIVKNLIMAFPPFLGAVMNSGENRFSSELNFLYHLGFAMGRLKREMVPDHNGFEEPVNS